MLQMGATGIEEVDFINKIDQYDFFLLIFRLYSRKFEH
jgi:hypothetical protein